MFEGDLNGEKEMAMNMWRKGVPGRGNSLYNGPEAGLWLQGSEQRGKGEGEG